MGFESLRVTTTAALEEMLVSSRALRKKKTDCRSVKTLIILMLVQRKLSERDAYCSISSLGFADAGFDMEGFDFRPLDPLHDDSIFSKKSFNGDMPRPGCPTNNTENV